MQGKRNYVYVDEIIDLVVRENPNEPEFHQAVREVLNSLETRVPFGDLDFVRYVMSVDPEKKINKYGKGKYLLRRAFERDGTLPESILWREKAAFSDAVGHSVVDDLKEYADAYYSDNEYEEKSEMYTFAKPFTKESLLYREIFEIHRKYL